MNLFIVIAVLIIIVSILLAAIVLIQKPKGGGLNAQFGGMGNQIFGASRTTDFVEKATWTLGTALAVLCIVSAFTLSSGKDAKKKTGAPQIERSEAEEALNGKNK
jgi:preprotein translocase subunit SecG